MKEKELLDYITNLIVKVTKFNQIKNNDDKQTIINDVFLKIWDKLQSGELEDNFENIKGYIFISAKNATIRFLQDNTKYNNRYSSNELNDDDFIIFDESYDNTIKDILYEVKDERLRDMIKLRLEGYKLDEIGEKYNLNKSQVSKIFKEYQSKKKYTNNGEKYKITHNDKSFTFKTLKDIGDFLGVSRQYVTQSFNTNVKVKKYIIEKL